MPPLKSWNFLFSFWNFLTWGRLSFSYSTTVRFLLVALKGIWSAVRLVFWSLFFRFIKVLLNRDSVYCIVFCSLSPTFPCSHYSLRFISRRETEVSLAFLSMNFSFTHVGEMFPFLIAWLGIFYLASFVSGKRALVDPSPFSSGVKRCSLVEEASLDSHSDHAGSLSGCEEEARHRVASQSLRRALQCRPLSLYRSLMDNVPLLDTHHAMALLPILFLETT